MQGTSKVGISTTPEGWPVPTRSSRDP